MTLLIFLAGVLLGSFIGVAVMCLCITAGDADRRIKALRNSPNAVQK